MEKLKYPIGRFKKPETIDQATIQTWINDIENFPAELKALAQNLSAKQLNLKYRPGG